MNRRNWLRIAGLSGVSVAVAPSLIGSSSSDSSINEMVDAGIIRLSSNENPYGPSDKVKKAITEGFDSLCRYPSSTYRALKEMIANRHGVQSSNVVLTAGSNEGLRATGLAFGINGGEIIAADPVYKALISYAEHVGAYIHRVSLTPNLDHNLAAMEQRITLATKLVFVCNPNNPTGSLLPAKDLQEFCRNVSDRTMVFSDEAYLDYVADPNYPSMVSLVKEGENVIVSRTFSKVYGLAGIRIGYLIARSDIASRIQKYVMAAPNILAVAAAKEAMEDEEFYKFSLDKANEAKEMIYSTLEERSLRYVPSNTNFVFFRTGKPIQEIQKAYMEKSIRVGRAFSPLLDWCRVSTGTIEEVGQFCNATRSIF
ncbi:MAG: aminotransferase class I/II-fold pyridoxal phosphate-dependent enzyme [Bacteroidia bacterium]|nr:aminotransferase class I/II-fold pyridoxal phosphate-dependent enzyme [Bacteroidia bacterium]